MDRQLQEGRRIFNWLVKRAKRAQTACLQDDLAAVAASYAWLAGVGIYGSETLETVFLRRAEELEFEAPDDFERGRVLMVMSEAYSFGGHTRVVERWIEADRSRRYSLAVMRQGETPVPDRLLEAVRASGGEIRLFDPSASLEARAARLREWSAGFESVVLHVHPDDPIPVIAYGTASFKRPVGLYNHADHAFWLGASVVDCVAELRQWGQRLTVAHRGIGESVVVGIPGDARMRTPADREQVRQRLGVSPGRKIVLTAGSACKYAPTPDADFLDIAVPLLQRDERVEIVGIGMTFDDRPEWQKVADGFGGRLRALGSVSNPEFVEWLSAADLVVGSRPFPGLTTIADAIDSGVPSLMTDTPVGLSDWMVGSPVCCRDVCELVDRATEILREPTVGRKLVDEARRRLAETRSVDRFLERVDVFLSRLGQAVHAVHRRNPVPADGCAWRYFRLGNKPFREMATDFYLRTFGKWDRETVWLRCRIDWLKAPLYLGKWIAHGCRRNGAKSSSGGQLRLVRTGGLVRLLRQICPLSAWRREWRASRRLFERDFCVAIAKHIGWMRAKDDIETLVLGSSHAYYGYWAESGEFNLGDVSLDLRRAFELAEYGLKAGMAKLKRIVVFVDVFSPGNVLEKSPDRLRLVPYAGLYGFRAGPVDASWRDGETGLSFAESEALFAKFARFLQVRIGEDYRGNFADDPQAASAPRVPVERRSSRLKSHLKLNHGEQCRYVERLRVLAERSGIRLVLVLPPLRSDFRSGLPGRDALMEALRRDVVRLDRTLLLDFLDDCRFDAGDFHDMDHLNVSGARKLAALVRAAIRQGDVQC